VESRSHLKKRVIPNSLWDKRSSIMRILAVGENKIEIDLMSLFTGKKQCTTMVRLFPGKNPCGVVSILSI
jgi:hypothetical protein